MGNVNLLALPGPRFVVTGDYTHLVFRPRPRPHTDTQIHAYTSFNLSKNIVDVMPTSILNCWFVIEWNQKRKKKRKKKKKKPEKTLKTM